MKIRKRLFKEEAILLKIPPKPDEKGRKNAKYYIDKEQWNEIKEYRKCFDINITTETKTNEYKEKFVLSAWNKQTGQMMDINTYCNHYALPRADISSYKLVSHTGTPYYNIAFKENVAEIVKDFDFNSSIKKYIQPITNKKRPAFNGAKDFDTLTITDVHVGMDTDADHNTMYQNPWNKKELFKTADIIISKTLEEQESATLYIDDLGDLPDGYNAHTTRGGHALPQNMTNEECFNNALEFKLKVLYGLVDHYDEINFNNICNDNHGGSFTYFINEAFKQIAEIQFKKVTVTNYRKFINHYYIGKICFVISHGKDDKSLKFGFKPQLDLKGAEKIDQYCKQNKIYKQADLVIFKKGDSHQALFDMCSSDDFFYFNYPALSPSSNWVKNNFKLGRRGFVNESFKGLKNYVKTHFI